jgi:hypothetical protein
MFETIADSNLLVYFIFAFYVLIIPSGWVRKAAFAGLVLLMSIYGVNL